jgi:seryl-tRNA synthetase
MELSADASQNADMLNISRIKANDLFATGVSQSRRSQVATITELSVKAHVLEFVITSGTAVRATDALLRFKNLVAQELGPGHKIGVRKVTVPSLTIEGSPREMNTDAIKRLVGQTAKVTATPSMVRVEFSNLTEKDLRVHLTDKVLRLSAQKEEVEAESSATFGAVLQSIKPKDIRFHEDPSKLAEESGWVVRFPGRGQWIFGPPMLSLVKGIKELIEDEICRPFGFKEWMFPRLLPMEVYKKLKTYVEHLPDGVFYVSAPPRDPSVFDEFKREYTLRGQLRTDLLKDILDEPGYVLDAVQCPPFYQTFSGRRVDSAELPIKAYDVSSGWTWRNEAGGTEGLVRTNEFYRMEMAFMGTPKDAQDIRDSLVDATARLVGNRLDLEWRLVAGAPFYLSPEEARQKVIDISSRDKIPTLDVECYLPYRGSRDQAEWLETSAGTVHRKYYVDAFRIKELHNREIWTGCLGHGLTRLAAAVLSQHGMDFENWPEPLRKKIGTLPPPIRFAK